MIKVVLSGSTEKSLRARNDSASVDNRTQFKLLASSRKDKADASEVVTFESLQVGLSVFEEIQNFSDFEDRDGFKISDYSLFCKIF